MLAMILSCYLFIHFITTIIIGIAIIHIVIIILLIIINSTITITIIAIVIIITISDTSTNFITIIIVVMINATVSNIIITFSGFGEMSADREEARKHDIRDQGNGDFKGK